MSVVISARKVSKVYQARSGDVAALKNFSYDFEAGLFYTIVGRSGSGKSTLLHILGGLDRPTSGDVLFNGESIYTMSDEKLSAFRRRHMGFVFQHYNLIEEYTVRNNIYMPLKLDRKKPDSAFFDEIVQTLGLEGKLSRYPCELSGGEQQRVAIARSVLARPELIIADEPTGNLDQKTGEKTLDLLIKCAAKNTQTLIIVTHDPTISDKADMTLSIGDGKLLPSAN
mgnify:CR=1 FL=1